MTELASGGLLSGLAGWVGQVVAVTSFSLRSISQRLGSSASAVFGIAGVVAVLVGVLSIGEGFVQTMKSEGSPDTVIVMRAGADSEMSSGLERETTRYIADAPGLARGAQGALASAELFVVINLPMRATGTDANVPLRGVEAGAFGVRQKLQIVAGRHFEWGKSEVIVGVGAAAQYAGLQLGNRLRVGQNEWEVVGIFAADGGISESEIWTDAGVLQSAYRRGDTFQVVYARLESAATFDTFKDALTTDPRLKVQVRRQSEYYDSQSRVLHGLIQVVGFIVAALMGLGAVFGALNTMYSAVSARTREISTLRALGFQAGPVVLSVMVESMLLALLGGLIGGGAAWLGFDGFRAATMNWQSFSQVSFAFAVSPELLAKGILYALVIGFIGGLLPALRAAWMPIATGLREL